MTTKRDFSRITQRLISLGYSKLLLKLQEGLTEPVKLQFTDLARAKRLQAILYDWLWFNPTAKSQVTLSIDPETNILWLKPRSKTEKRGRKGSKRS